MNVVAGVYVHGRATRVIVRVEIELRVVGDCSIVRTISTISGTCGAGRDFMDVDGVYRRGKFGDHIGLLPVCVGTASVPCWDDAYSLQLKRVDLISLYVNTDAIRFAEVYARFGVPPFLATGLFYTIVTHAAAGVCLIGAVVIAVAIFWIEATLEKMTRAWRILRVERRLARD
jgi:hypothetical protein